MSATTSSEASRAIVSGRLIDAPREKVFKAFSDPARLARCDQDGKTRVGWRMLFESAAERDRIAPVAGPANEQNFDRLEAELAARS